MEAPEEFKKLIGTTQLMGGGLFYFIFTFLCKIDPIF